ncbi:MAG: TAXI family TRAP transporter solute-binding subunit [Planctomycetes bacterium]|nr:TAXI family TRAP transporter solute-binding subunit [Planctomycetota bacterium]
MQPASRASGAWNWLVVATCTVASLVAGYVVLVEAPPPRTLVIAAGSKDGAYHRFAVRYAELLKQDGIAATVRVTKGSVENVQLLLDEDSDVYLAFVQSGIADPAKCGKLQALCSLYREPLWIFYRGEKQLDRISQLKAKRIAIGPDGSGTRAITLQLLQANEMNEQNVELLPLSGGEAAEALERGEIEAAFFVASIEALYIQRLIKDPEIHLMELTQTEAYLRRFRFLSTVTVHAGLLDLQNNLPASDTVLLAPAATLVAHESLHPALIPLILKAASKVHRTGDLLTDSGEFPTAAYTDLPVSEEAEHYFRYGPPVLQRFLPFWLASLIDRTKLMIIPLLVLLMPLFRVTPPLVRWRHRRKIYLWYVTLREIDQRAIHGMSTVDAQKSLDGLKVLEQQIAGVGVPLSYMEEYYNLRLHLHLVRSRVELLALQH